MPEKEKELQALQAQAEKAKATELRADKLMNTAVTTIYETTQIYMAIQTLATKRISGAPVVNNSDKLVGVISEYDLLMQAATKDLKDVVQFTKNVVSATPTTTLKELIVQFHKTKVRWMPVVGPEHRVIGIVTRLDVLKALLPKAG